MPHKVVAIFGLEPEDVAEEIRRTEILAKALLGQPGFLAFEVMKVTANRIIIIQTWETEGHCSAGFPKAAAVLADVGPDLVIFREVYAGEVAVRLRASSA